MSFDRRRLKVRYSKADATTDVRWATIETAKGFYVCTVENVTDEGARKFRARVRSLQHAIEQYPHPLITTSDET